MGDKNKQGENSNEDLGDIRKGRERLVLSVIPAVPPRSTHHEGEDTDGLKTGRGILVSRPLGDPTARKTREKGGND